MTALIRPRTEEDIPALADVLVRVHAQDGYPVEGVADPAGWLRSDRTLGAWVAEMESSPVGQVMLTEPGEGDEAARLLSQHEGIPLDRLAVICRLFVDPDARGNRVSSALIDAAVSAAETNGRRVALDVMLKDQAAIAIYRRTGWRFLGKFNHAFLGGSEPAVALYLPIR